MKTSPLFFLALSLAVLVFNGCDDDDGPMGPEINVPATYSFERDGASSVSFSGQTTRIGMAEELATSMKDANLTEINLLEMFRNQTASGDDANPFADADLNASTKSISSKVAASADFFSANTAGQAQIRAEFETYINDQVTNVFPRWNELAVAGSAGQIADGSSTRYVNAQGLEYNQALAKSLIGGLMLDQALNNYLSPVVLDAGSNREDNNAGLVATDKNYTSMEHKWDEAFGYVYGASADPANANLTTGDDDSFLNKYLGRVEGDADFAGISMRVFDAFKRGRAAIVANDYGVRDEQAEILRKELSIVIGVRAVYYLQQAKNILEASTIDYGAAFHELSEAYGFIYSLQFTRKANSAVPYFSSTEVANLLTDLLDDGANGLWNLTPATITTISNTIADQFDFSVAEAATIN